jgi:hypothetical protein
MSEKEAQAAARVAEIRERLEKATPGPRKAGGGCVLFARKCDPGENLVGDYAAPYGISISGEMIPTGGYLPAGPECDDTAAFIAHAPEDVAWLLADRERQVARIDALERAAKNVCIAAHAFGWDSPELAEKVFRLGQVVDEETDPRSAGSGMASGRTWRASEAPQRGL